MKYTEINKYKYRLAETVTFYVGIFPSGQYSARTDFLELTPKGFLTIQAGYCWDGATFPGVDTKNVMTPSLVHDAGYQLIRLGLLPKHTKPEWDALLKEMCLVRGMTKLRASYIHAGVALGGHGSVDFDQKRDLPEVLEAP